MSNVIHNNIIILTDVDIESDADSIFSELAFGISQITSAVPFSQSSLMPKLCTSMHCNNME